MDAIVDYDDPNFVDAVLRGKWAYIHQIENKALFSYKVDIELNEPFRWNEALVSFAKEIGGSVAYSDENSPTDGDLIEVNALGVESKLTVTPDLYDAE